MNSLNRIRRGLTNEPNHLDYKAMVEIRARRVWRTMSGRRVLRQGSSDITIQLHNILRLQLADEAAPGTRYALNEAGDAALDRWLANRPTYPSPEGTRS